MPNLPYLRPQTWLEKYIRYSGFYPGSGSDFKIMFNEPIIDKLKSSRWVFVDHGGPLDDHKLIQMACGNEIDFHNFEGLNGYARVSSVIDITDLFQSCYQIGSYNDDYPQKVLYRSYYNENKNHTIEAIFLMGFDGMDAYEKLYNQGGCALFLIKEGLGTKESQHTKWEQDLVRALGENSPAIIVSNNGPYGGGQYNKCVGELAYQEQDRIKIEEQYGLERTEMRVFKKLGKMWLKKYIRHSGFYPGSGSDFEIMFNEPIIDKLKSSRWVFVDHGGPLDDHKLIQRACGNEIDFHNFEGLNGYARVSSVIDITDLFQSCYEIDPYKKYPQKVLYRSYYNKNKNHTIEAIFLMGFDGMDAYEKLYNQGGCALLLSPKRVLGTKGSQGTANGTRFG